MKIIGLKIQFVTNLVFMSNFSAPQFLGCQNRYMLQKMQSKGGQVEGCSSYLVRKSKLYILFRDLRLNDNYLIQMLGNTLKMQRACNQQAQMIDTKSSGSQRQTQNSSIDCKTNDLTNLIICSHKKFGNKWHSISKQLLAQHFQGTQTQFLSENSIKNLFYSLLRQAVLKINNYLKSKEHESRKPFKECFVFKISNLAQSERQNFAENPEYTFRELLYEILEFNNNTELSKSRRPIKIEDLFSPLQIEKTNSMVSSMSKIEKLYSAAKLNKKGELRKKASKQQLIAIAYQAKTSQFHPTDSKSGQHINDSCTAKSLDAIEDFDIQELKMVGQDDPEIELKAITSEEEVCRPEHESSGYLQFSEIYDPALFNG